MPNQSSEFIASARAALQRGDQKAAVSLLNQVLKHDLHHAEAWQLLHAHFGRGDALETFQQKYAQKHFPNQVKELRAGRSEPDSGSLKRVSLGKPRGQKGPSPPEKSDRPPTPKKERRPGLLASLFGRFGRKEKSASPPLPPPPSQKSPAGETRQTQEEAKPGLSLAALKAPPAAPEEKPAREDFSLSPLDASTPILRPAFEPAPLPPEGEKVRVLVVDDIAQTRENLLKLLTLVPEIETVGAAHSGSEAIKLAVETNPDVILMDINMPDMDGLQATRIVRSKTPHAQVIILTVQDDPSYMREAIQAGARDFLVKPPMVEELISAVHRAYVIAKEEKARRPAPAPPTLAGIASPFQAAGLTKKIIAVFSPKGGVGCTTLTTNLSVALQRDDRQVAVVDGCLEFGGIAISFNERSKNSLLDLTPRVEHLDPDVVSEVIITHAASNVNILPAPERPELGGEVYPDQLAALLKYMASIYSFVLVDTASTLDEHTLAVLDASDLVLLVTTQDIPALDRTRRFLDLVPAIGLNQNRFRLVLNRYSDRIKITADRISENFKREVIAVIPYDYAVVGPATNQGQPFMLDSKIKGRPIFKAFTDLARVIQREMEAYPE